MQCEIVLTGNELLIGKTQDTNGLWMIKQLNPLGVRITRMTTIRDNLREIASTIRDALLRRPDYIFVSGGLGPTFDDMTLQGLADGISPPLPLELHPEAEQFILKRYQKRNPQVDLSFLKDKYPHFQKMAEIPFGSYPLRNPAGTAPAVYFPPNVTNDKTRIIAMPGIPEELESIFLMHILPEIQSHLADAQFLECGFTIEKIPESGMAQQIYEIKDQFPELWFKTHPHRSETKQWQLELHISTFSTNSRIKEQMLTSYDVLKQYVVTHNGKVSKEHPLS